MTATTNTTSKTIRLSANLRQLAGGDTLTVSVPGSATVRDLFQALRQTSPKLGNHILTDEGVLNPGIQMLVDGRHIDFLQGLDTPVGQAKDLFLIPPIYGG